METKTYPAPLVDRLRTVLAELTEVVAAFERHGAGEPWEGEGVEIEVDLGAELNEAVCVIAKQLGVTPNEIIVRAVREYIARHDAAATT